MPLYKPSELDQFLKENQISPNKKLSQNFLIDGNVLKKILESAAIKKGDLVIEIGPGPGALTEGLLSYGAEVIAIEKDTTLAQHLKTFKSNRLQVIAEDFRNVELHSLLKRRGEKKIKIVANIPYHLTGIILQTLLPRRELIESMYLMVQKEVADRCTAPVGTKYYSSFTLFVDYHSWAHGLFRVSKGSFYPKPQVDSAVLAFQLKAPPVAVSYERLFKMIRAAFQKRRKMLRSSLKELRLLPSKIEAALENMGLAKESRPQDLTLVDFATLFTSLYPKEKGTD